MEKVKVSKEVAEAIEWYEKECEKNGVMRWEDELIYCHSHVNDEWLNERVKPLAKLSSFELASILVLGYEIELTPEEMILKEYNCRFDALDKNERWFCDGVLFVLKTLNIEIKGVNVQ